MEMMETKKYIKGQNYTILQTQWSYIFTDTLNKYWFLLSHLNHKTE